MNDNYPMHDMDGGHYYPTPTIEDRITYEDDMRNGRDRMPPTDRVEFPKDDRRPDDGMPRYMRCG